MAVVLPDRPLVFGGHPAITPLVWEIASRLGLVDRVFIYQSEHFRSRIPPEAVFFDKLVWTRDVGGPADRSIAHMRDLMIVRRTDETGTMRIPEFTAGVFISGMNGVEDEWDLFRLHYPTVPVFPVASTEGAARLITRTPARMANAPGLDPPTVTALEQDLAYRRLFRRLLSQLP
ncbi:hypothetical protein J0H58_15160 [bacterium]|nr:hypothetical protein [bacterium]